MFEQERKLIIFNQLNEEMSVSVTELAEKLEVSVATVRRDLIDMENKGLIKRTHGGAVLAQNVLDSFNFNLKQSKYQTQKEKIAKRAASFIKDGDVVFIDSSTVTVLIPQYIKAKNFTVITNSINIAQLLKGNSECSLTILGGLYMTQAETIEGPTTVSQLKNLRFKKAFLGANGIDEHFGFSAMSESLAASKRTAIEQAHQSYFVCENKKFDYTSLHKICDLSEVNYLITDNEIDSQILEKYRGSIEIIVAE